MCLDKVVHPGETALTVRVTTGIRVIEVRVKGIVQRTVYVLTSIQYDVTVA